MRQKLHVMVAEREMRGAVELKKYLEEKEEMEEVHAMDDGIQVYEMIKQWKPEVAVLDLSLKNMGGMEVMERLRQEKEASSTSFFLLSATGSDAMVEKAAKLGASYFLMYPCQPESIYRRIVKNTGNQEAAFSLLPDLEENTRNQKEEGRKLEAEVTRIIRELGIPAHIKGYYYIRDSIMLAVEDMQILNYITKLLYPTIAKKYKTTSSSVERAIRHAIEVAFARGKADLLEEMFGYRFHNGKTKPTNSEFIALISDRLHMKIK